MNDEQRKTQNAREIDFTKWMNTDNLNDIKCKIEGLQVIQYALSADYEHGSYVNGQYAFEVIADSLNTIAKEIEALKPKLDYMDSFARVGTDELVKEDIVVVQKQIQ